ncbi:MAG: DegT/DnrJ/EryC1/StrS family aminotransferase [Planctomycetota bacterium]
MNTPPIPMVALGPDDAAERAEWITALTRTVDTNAYCLGAEVTAFEQQVREYLDVPHVFALSNGSDALRIGLQAIGVEADTEVVVPAYSFFASASSIAHLGAKPVFVDVDPNTLLMDPNQLERAITAKTSAVMPVHLYGQGAAMRRIMEVCAARRVPVLEDAAQAFGTRYDGRALGSLGAAGTFSFYPTKNLAAPGDAGMVVTRDAAIAERLRLLRVHGDAGGYQHVSLGWNARMDGFQGAVLAVRLKRLPALQAARAQNAARYDAAIRDLGLAQQVRPLGRTPHSEHTWHQYIVRLSEREKVRAALAQQNIGCAVYYPGTLPAQPAFKSLGHRVGDFPVAEAAAREVLALPIHHRLKPEDPRRVIEAISACLR